MSDNLPPINDHAFWREVKKRLMDYSKSMPEVAAELGVDCKELVRWIERYQPPKKHTSRDTSKHGPAIEAGGFPLRTHAAMARGFENWRKGKVGA